MILTGLFFSGIFEVVEDVVGWISSVIEDINRIFADVDFTVLYSWLPSDIQTVITAILAILLFIALIGLLKKCILFLG